MISLAGASDAGRLDAFLADHAETSMFLRANLARHGTNETTHRHGTAFYLWQTGAGIDAVFGLTNGGMLTCQVPDPTRPALAAFAGAIAGREICGITGIPEQVAAVLDALGLGMAEFELMHDEPLCLCTLADLPAGDENVRRPQPADMPLLQEWWRDYYLETGLTSDPAKARQEASAQARHSVETGDHLLLLEDGHPVAMAGLNARLPEIVQVGGVFVPADRRNRGLGRRVTAATPRKARAEGVARAVLFANNDAAERAYAAIGFRRIGQFRIAMMGQPTVASAPGTGVAP